MECVVRYHLHATPKKKIKERGNIHIDNLVYPDNPISGFLRVNLFILRVWGL